MNLQLFYRYGALLCALGLIEASPMNPYYVTSLTSGGVSAGAGFLCYFYSGGRFKFVPEKYRYYGEIKDAFLQRDGGSDADQRVTQVVSRLIADSVREAKIPEPKEGTEYFYLDKITSHSSSIKEKSLQFQYEGKQVKITFSDKRGLEATVEILTVLGRQDR